MSFYTSGDVFIVDASGNFATSSDCCCGVSGETWNDCDTDEELAIFSLSGTPPSDDYAWLCVSGIYIKAYSLGEGLISGTPTDPTWVELDATPLSCADLHGLEANDFDGGSTASTSTADANFTERWSPNPGGSGVTILGSGNCRLTVLDSPNPNFSAITMNPPAIDQFYCEVEWAENTAGTGTDVRPLRLHVTVGGTLTRIIKQGSSDWSASIGASGGTLASSGASYSGKARIRISSGTVYLDGDIGSGWTNILSGAAPGSGLLGNITLTIHDNATPATQITDYWNFVLTDDGVDGTGTPIYLNDITGDAC